MTRRAFLVLRSPLRAVDCFFQSEQRESVTLIDNSAVPTRSRWRSSRVVGVGAIVIAALGLSACGSSGTSQEELNQARKQGASHAQREQRLRTLEQELKHIKKGGPPGSSGGTTTVPATPSSPSPCGAELSVREGTTTCPFAVNVKEAYFAEIGSGSGTIEAYSPTTGKLYAMYCTGSPHECTGGHEAAVYFP
jgi:hypothetical protein